MVVSGLVQGRGEGDEVTGMSGWICLAEDANAGYPQSRANLGVPPHCDLNYCSYRALLLFWQI